MYTRVIWPWLVEIETWWECLSLTRNCENVFISVRLSVFLSVSNITENERIFIKFSESVRHGTRINCPSMCNWPINVQCPQCLPQCMLCEISFWFWSHKNKNRGVIIKEHVFSLTNKCFWILWIIWKKFNDVYDEKYFNFHIYFSAPWEWWTHLMIHVSKIVLFGKKLYGFCVLLSGNVVYNAKVMWNWRSLRMTGIREHIVENKIMGM